MTLSFEDGSSRYFERKYDETNRRLDGDLTTLSERSQRRYIASRYDRGTARRFLPSVTVKFYDRGNLEIRNLELNLARLNIELVARALERTGEAIRLGYDTYRFRGEEEIVSLSTVLERHGPELLSNTDFTSYIERHEPGTLQRKDLRLDCVFIETQRLINSKTASNAGADKTTGSEEEILRQAEQLSNLLKEHSTRYAVKSQALDRSFPNRLVKMVQTKAKTDLELLKSELLSIENKRQLLTEAGILVEQSEQLNAPSDAELPQVAEALQIYALDSKDKLSTYDEIYPKVSTFKEIMDNKLKPKKLVFSRDLRPEVWRDSARIALEKLSSGEKHEFVMLYKLIFETPQASIVLIDEPEISLHVVWQLEVLPDLMRIQGTTPFQCIIATHSPQIFQGYERLIVDLADQAK